jgi:transcriptional regulator with XRE-family HTH domain
MIYNRIETLLKSHNISQYKLAKDTGISQGNISDWKNGRSNPTQSNLQKIADYFDTSTDYLLGRKTMPNFENTVKSEVQVDFSAPISDSQLLFALVGEHDITDDEVIGDIKAAAQAAAQAIANRKRK